METIGKYHVRAVLGRGGMGTVYEAVDPLIHRTVALKVMGEGLVQNASLRERFLREAQAAGALHHRNIVTVYDFGDDGERPYIAMELVEGTDLATIIQNREPLSVEWKLDVVRQIAEGLGYAHRQGVVHRDVKPANVRVTPSGEVKIVDFGIARLPGGGITRGGRVLGTIHYTAPEQIEGRPTDHRADVFSVGAIAYELLAYRKPFEGDTITDVMFRILNERPDPGALPRTAYSPGLEEIVVKALARDVQERYLSLEDLRGDLEELVRRTAARVLAEPEPAAGLLEEARHERSAGRLGEALRRTREAADLDPGAGDARALLEELEGEERQARATRWVAEGRQQIAESPRKALEFANQALALAPGHAAAAALAREAETAALGTRPQGRPPAPVATEAPAPAPSGAGDASREARAALDRARTEGKLHKALALCLALLEREPGDAGLAGVAAALEAEIQAREVEQLAAVALSYVSEGDVELAGMVVAKIGMLAPGSPRHVELTTYLDQERRRRAADALAATGAEHLALGNVAEARAAAEEALTAVPSHDAARGVRDAAEQRLRSGEAPNVPAGLPLAAEEPVPPDMDVAAPAETILAAPQLSPTEPAPPAAAVSVHDPEETRSGLAALPLGTVMPPSGEPATPASAAAADGPLPVFSERARAAAEAAVAAAAAASGESPPLTPVPEGAPHDGRAARLVEDARQALRARAPARAVAPLEEAAALEPGHPAIVRLLEAARAQAARAHIEELATEALDRFVSGRYAAARVAVAELLRLDPANRKGAELQAILATLP